MNLRALVTATTAALALATPALSGPAESAAVDAGTHRSIAAGASSVLHADIPYGPIATWSAGDYDSVQNTKDAPDVTSLPQVHAVYLYGKDGKNQFGSYAPMFQAESKRASSLFNQATGMGFRWDLRRAADGRLLHDITVLRARKYTTAQLSATTNDGVNVQFQRTQDELKQAGLSLASKKYFVYLDGGSTVCGVSTGNNDYSRAATNTANNTSVSVAVRYYPPSTTNANGQQTGGWCMPVLHELSHAFGALQSIAPHFIPGGHCNDDAQDFMCSTNVTPNRYDPTAMRRYDTNNDDYLDPSADRRATVGGKLAWWTVNLNKFSCPRGFNLDEPDCSKPNSPQY